LSLARKTAAPVQLICPCVVGRKDLMTKFYPAAVGDTTRTRVRQSLRREYGAGVLTDCATLQEAVLAWHKLAPEQKIRATVKVIGGRVYISARDRAASLWTEAWRDRFPPSEGWWALRERGSQREERRVSWGSFE
jgi:hypothetical protein